MNIVQKFEQKQIEKLMADKNIPDFGPGDTVQVSIKINEGGNDRFQIFEGLCIGRRNCGVSSSFTLRKISNGEGVEYKFPMHASFVHKVTVLRYGVVRRAKLYYMRELRGKAARIKERRYVKA